VGERDREGGEREREKEREIRMERDRVCWVSNCVLLCVCVQKRQKKTEKEREGGR
jgi:hypothetical protein